MNLMFKKRKTQKALFITTTSNSVLFEMCTEFQMMLFKCCSFSKAVILVKGSGVA